MKTKNKVNSGHLDEDQKHYSDHLDEDQRQIR